MGFACFANGAVVSCTLTDSALANKSSDCVLAAERHGERKRWSIPGRLTCECLEIGGVCHRRC